MTQPLPCIVCSRQMGSAANDPSFDAIPYAGTLFFALGHYGSTVFDPMDGTQLEIVVCDDCLTARRQRVNHVAITTSHAISREPWHDCDRGSKPDRAETPQSGSVHESPGAEGNRP